MTMNKRGRPRRGGPDLRASIVDAAHASFLAHGYGGSTLRAIADTAGCDVALIGYYFGSKRHLFEEVAALRIGPAEVLARVLAGPRHDLGIRMVVGLLSAWEAPDAGGRLVRLIRQALSEDETRSALVGYLEREFAQPIVEYLGGEHSSARAAAAVAALAGVLMARYLLALPLVASMSAADFAAQYAPVVESALEPRR
jgi:AcrR family transcriptional regulator